MTFRFWLNAFLLFFMLVLPSLAFTQDTPDLNGKDAEKVEIPLTLAEVIDRVERFQKSKDAIAKNARNLLSPEIFEQQIQELEGDFSQTKELLFKKKQLSSWGHLKIDDFLSRAKPLYQKSQKLKSGYLDFLKNSQKHIQDLNDRKDFFADAIKKLRSDSLLEKQKPVILMAMTDLEKSITKIEKIRSQNTQIYKEHSAIFLSVEKFYDDLKNQQRTFQKNLLEKTRPSVYEGGFWRLFNKDLWKEIKYSWLSLSDVNLSLASEDLPGYLLLALIFIVAFFSIRYLKKYDGFPANQIPSSIFITLFAASFLIKYPIPLVILLCWIGMPFLLYRLISSYQFHSKSAPYLLRLFVAYSLIRIIEIVDFPLVFYRIFIVTLSLFVSLYAFLQYKKVSDWESQSGIKRFLFIATIALFMVTAVAEVFGFHAFAVYMVHGVIQSAFLVFALLFSRVFLFQFVSFALKLNFLNQIKIVSHYKDSFLKQFCQALKLATWVVGLLIFPTIWGVYSDIGQAYQKISEFGFSLAGHKMTLGMIGEAVVFFFIAYFIGFVLCAFLEDEVYPRKQIERGVAKSINSLVSYSLWILGAFLAFFALGFELKQLALIAGALSVGIGFGLQNIVNNFVSGIILLFERPVKIGDLLEIKGEWGEVEKMGLRSTTIRTYSKTQLIIPNSDFITQSVTNLTLSDSEYRLVIPVGIAYGSDTKLAQEVMQKVLDGHDKVLENPEPRVFFNEFGGSSLNFELLVWIQDVSMKREVVSSILFEIDQRFREHKIEIPFPQRDLHVRSLDDEIVQKLVKDRSAEKVSERLDETSTD